MEIRLAFGMSKSSVFQHQCSKCTWWWRELDDDGICVRCAPGEADRKANKMWCWKCKIYTNHNGRECEKEKSNEG